MDGLAVGTREEGPVDAPGAPGHETAFLFSLAMVTQDAERRRVEPNASTPPCCLGCVDMQRVTRNGEPARDREVGLVEVEVAPPQPKELAAPHPRGRCEQPQGEQIIVTGELE